MRALIALLAGSNLAAAPIAPTGGPPEPTITLVETQPAETPMNRAEVPDAADLWPDLIDRARSSLEVAAFYVSREPGGKLDPVLDAIRRAGARGARVRILADAGFYDTYPEVLDELAVTPGIRVRLVDFRGLAGGPMHAKYFIVDGRDAYLGSQNMDWRALEHIHEMGAVVRHPDFAAALVAIFDRDWDAASPLGPGDAETSTLSKPTGLARWPLIWTESSGDTVTFWPALSPAGFLPDSTLWDLPRLIDLLRGATTTLRATCLTYNPEGRDGSYWETLDAELRRAGARGVTVRLLVADWSKRRPAVDHLKSLAAAPGIEVRFVTYPEASRGFIPFARVTHAKYLTVDGEAVWLGTSNWEKSYFFGSRNVGFIARSRALAAGLDADFTALWESPYAVPVDPCATYEPPRIGE